MQSALSLSLAATLLLAAAGLAGCKRSEGAAPEAAHDAAGDAASAIRAVATARVEPADAGATAYTGIVGARVQSDLGFRIQGKVIARLVDTGQQVTRGQVLMRIDPTDYSHAEVAQAGNVAAARARWTQADADERRDRGLVATGAISKSAYDAVKAAADSAKALLDAAAAQERVTRNQEDYSTLLADGDGTVVETLAEPGQVVAAGQTVVRLAHAGPREAVVNLPETVRPEIGSAGTAMLYGGLVVPARLRQLSDAADPRTRTFEARYVMAGAGAAAPLGATVTIGLSGSGQAALLRVPLGALDDEGRGPGVWVIEPGTAKVRYRPVQVQVVGTESALVRGALAQGETVVAAGGHYLHAGEQVRPAVIQAAMQ